VSLSVSVGVHGSKRNPKDLVPVAEGIFAGLLERAESHAPLVCLLVCVCVCVCVYLVPVA